MTDKPKGRMIDGEFIANDGLESMITALGDPSRDKSASTFYGARLLADNQLENSYRFGWIVPKIVDNPAKDATRKWRGWSAEADQITRLEETEKRLKVQIKTKRALQMAALWGGAAIYVNTGQDPAQPLELRRVGRDGIRSLTVFTRKELNAEELERNPLDENYGRANFFTIAGATDLVKIHHSHLVIFVGHEHPDPWLQAGQNQGWGDSVVQRVFDSVRNADSTMSNIASMVFEANVDVISVPDLLAKMGDKDYESRILKRFGLAAKGKGVNGTLLIDAAEEYNRRQTTFTGLPDVMKGFLHVVAAAAGQPIARFLGEQTKGMGDSGQGDMKIYHEEVHTRQTLEIEPAMVNMDEAIIRSALGARPDDVTYAWTPLEQMSEKEVAEIGKTTAETAKHLVETGLYQPEVIEEALTSQLAQTGAFPGIDNLAAENKKDFDLDFGGEDDDGETGAEMDSSDAAPRSLYIRRDVKNADEIVAWAKEQGFDDIVDDLHVTIAYSREALDWMAIGDSWASEMTIPAGGARIMESFDGGATVLLFKASELEWRHQSVLNSGGSFDFDEYQPHITISFGDAPLITSIEPYQGEIVLGPEMFEEIDDSFMAEVTKAVFDE